MRCFPAQCFCNVRPISIAQFEVPRNAFHSVITRSALYGVPGVDLTEIHGLSIIGIEAYRGVRHQFESMDSSHLIFRFDQ